MLTRDQFLAAGLYDLRPGKTAFQRENREFTALSRCSLDAWSLSPKDQAAVLFSDGDRVPRKTKKERMSMLASSFPAFALTVLAALHLSGCSSPKYAIDAGQLQQHQGSEYNKGGALVVDSMCDITYVKAWFADRSHTEDDDLVIDMYVENNSADAVLGDGKGPRPINLAAHKNFFIMHDGLDKPLAAFSGDQIEERLASGKSGGFTTAMSVFGAVAGTVGQSYGAGEFGGGSTYNPTLFTNSQALIDASADLSAQAEANNAEIDRLIEASDAAYFHRVTLNPKLGDDDRHQFIGRVNLGNIGEHGLAEKGVPFRVQIKIDETGCVHDLPFVTQSSS